MALLSKVIAVVMYMELHTPEGSNKQETAKRKGSHVDCFVAIGRT